MFQELLVFQLFVCSVPGDIQWVTGIVEKETSFVPIISHKIHVKSFCGKSSREDFENRIKELQGFPDYVELLKKRRHNLNAGV